MKVLIKFYLLIFVAGLLPMVAIAQEAPSLPLQISDEKWRPLRKNRSEQLEKALKKELSKNKLWQQLVSKKRMAVGIVDLGVPDKPRFAALNGDVTMYAASLPKIAVLLAACQAIEDGRLQQSPQNEDDLNSMIRESSNVAATRMIDSLGFDNIESVLRDPRYEFYDDTKGGGLWVGKRYAKTDKRHPDPLKGLSHAASVTQVCRFYYLLATGRLVSKVQSEHMLSILADPGLHHKFVSTLDEIAPKATIYRKSGTWRNWHSDSVLVWGPEKRRYILVALVDHVNGEAILRDLVPVTEKVIFANPGKKK